MVLRQMNTLQVEGLVKIKKWNQEKNIQGQINIYNKKINI